MTVHGFVQRATTQCSLLLCEGLFLFGRGAAMAMPAMMTEINKATEAVEAHHPGVFGDRGAYAQAYGLNNAAFAAGAIAGPLYAGYMREWVGWMTTCVSLGAISLRMVVLVAVFAAGNSRDARSGSS